MLKLENKRGKIGEHQVTFILEAKHQIDYMLKKQIFSTLYKLYIQIGKEFSLNVHSFKYGSHLTMHRNFSQQKTNQEISKFLSNLTNIDKDPFDYK